MIAFGTLLTLLFCTLKHRNDMLQLMLNAHKDTDKNEIEDEHSYDGDPEKWKKRGDFYFSFFFLYI
jgi:hypothetical protein